MSKREKQLPSKVDLLINYSKPEQETAMKLFLAIQQWEKAETNLSGHETLLSP